jgi:hypothetical protein
VKVRCVPATAEGGAVLGVFVMWAALTAACGRVLRGAFFGLTVAVVASTPEPAAVVVAAVVAATDVVGAAAWAVVITAALVVVAPAVDVAAEVVVLVVAAEVVAVVVIVDVVEQAQPVVVGGAIGVEQAQPLVGVVGATTVGGFGGAGCAGTDKQPTVHACRVAWFASAVAA